MTAKTAANSGAFKKGTDARRGGGKKGRSGRKPLEFKAECDRLTNAEVLPRVERYLVASDAGDPAWRWAAEFVAGYSKQKPTEKQTHDGEVVIRIVRGAKAA